MAQSRGIIRKLGYLTILLWCQSCGQRQTEATRLSEAVDRFSSDTLLEEPDSIWVAINDSMGFLMANNEETRLKMSAWQAVKRFEDKDFEAYDYDSNADTTTYLGFPYQSREGEAGQYTYHFDLSGTDLSGNKVSAKVEVKGKFGKGWVRNADGEYLYLEVSWNKHHELVGVDAQMMDYTFRPL
ncbi:hypothetical protein CLV98_11545 [Dyadobacter jejuensis]|uniref:Uncharacterized protein n=1 Tax=Dyadobacter jejuensis TaxID=1082580 RepID=A0A316AB71_9BACT|nr:hypothetical protein [Dyadobacter jejuensis]PWJ55026.1 hypothetical protein CLV98_11545 [Dyadobacter jejuensis]